MDGDLWLSVRHPRQPHVSPYDARTVVDNLLNSNEIACNACNVADCERMGAIGHPVANSGKKSNVRCAQRNLRCGGISVTRNRLNGRIGRGQCIGCDRCRIRRCGGQFCGAGIGDKNNVRQ